MALSLEPVRGARARRIRLALRLARRDIGQHRARSALIALLIALPIAVMSAGTTLALSSVATPEEQVLQELGQTSGRVSLSMEGGERLTQGPRGDLDNLNSSDIREPGIIDPAAVLPAGFQRLSWTRADARTPVDGVDLLLTVVAADVFDPAFAGKYALDTGRAPAAPSESVVSAGLLERFGLELGDTLRTSVADTTIVGTIRAAGIADAESVLYLPAATDLSEARAAKSVVYLVGDRPLTWADTPALNAQSLILTSRELILYPPTDAEIGPDAAEIRDYTGSQGWGDTIIPVLLVGTVALLEVGLLSGAAFAVGARHQRRSLALLAATGAEAGTLRSLVTASGLWLGLTGGVLGAAVGIGGAAIIVALSSGTALFPALRVFWLAALGLVVLAVVAGVIAALVPAISVARQSTLGSLWQGPREARTQRGAAVTGGIFVGLSALAFAGACGIALYFRRREYLFMWEEWTLGAVLVGAVLLVIGLIVLTGPLVRLLGRRTGWLPVPFRLAARDSVRNTGRTVPAIAAVLAASMIAGAVLVSAATSERAENTSHLWRYNQGQTGVPLDYSVYPESDDGVATLARADSAEVTAALTAALGQSATTHILSGGPTGAECYVAGFDWGGEDPAPACPEWKVATPEGNACDRANAYDREAGNWRCQGSMARSESVDDLPSIAVGGADDLAELLGRQPSAAAQRTLANGGIVLSNAVFEENGSARVLSINAFIVLDDDGDPVDVPQPLSDHRLDAVVDAPNQPLPYYGMISPETAQRIGLPTAERVVLVDLRQELTPAQFDRLQAAAATTANPEGYVWVEEGSDSILALVLWLVVLASALVTLSAAGITAGLALADGRDDQRTLASIGASPRLRRALAAAQSLVTSLLGTALGLLAGTIPMLVLFALFEGQKAVIPWAHFGILLLAVPLCGAGAAWLFTRSRLPLTRRATLS